MTIVFMRSTFFLKRWRHVYRWDFQRNIVILKSGAAVCWKCCSGITSSFVQPHLTAFRTVQGTEDVLFLVSSQCNNNKMWFWYPFRWGQFGCVWKPRACSLNGLAHKLWRDPRGPPARVETISETKGFSQLLMTSKIQHSKLFANICRTALKGF